MFTQKKKRKGGRNGGREGGGKEKVRNGGIGGIEGKRGRKEAGRKMKKGEEKRLRNRNKRKKAEMRNEPRRSLRRSQQTFSVRRDGQEMNTTNLVDFHRNFSTSWQNSEKQQATHYPFSLPPQINLCN